MTCANPKGLMLAATLTLLAGAAQAEVPNVVTDIPPVGSLVSQVMGDLGKPVVLTGKGADPHDFQMRPSQASALSKADIVFWIGPELTPWLDHALKGVGAEGRAVALLHAKGTTQLSYAVGEGDPGAEGNHNDKSQKDEGHKDGGHDHEGHDQEGLNPHAWLDPDNAQVWLKLIAADLSAKDPAHAATYDANAAAAAKAIAAADTAAKATLTPVRGAPIVVFHDAFGYFARHYGLNVAGSVAEGDAATPGAKRLADIHDMLDRTGAVCVFPEDNHDPKLVEAVVSGTKAKIGAPLDPAGTSQPMGPDLYETLIERLAHQVADCAG
ncbi:zinc ABC transporter substrate-binding protein [Acidimangrovimonas sediminis]|uniref:zinc ABC transporter substrate-binding protein n=1 Tax=Acidimangrovimonas sediminis TaxID=2056283 RepID=UPI001E3E7013|nr:zinc ABC transporter substrate-binding protein [Acidimangrovimonas sediminis]